MTALEKMVSWIKTYPGYDLLGDFQIDYTDHVPNVGSLAPSGLVEVDRRQDIFGNATVTNQYNFGLYCVFEKAPDDNAGATINADWIMDFQEWAQEQSLTGLAPVFGDVPQMEQITAQNGMLFAIPADGTATYMVQMSVRFKKKFEVKNEWLT